MNECSPAPFAGLVQFAFQLSSLEPVAGERRACLCIDVQPPTLAPLLERLRANDGAHNSSASSALVFLSERGVAEPLGVGAVHGVAIGHKAFDLVEVLLQVPVHDYR